MNDSWNRMDSYRQLDGNEIEHEDVFAPRDYTRWIGRLIGNGRKDVNV